jgi:hypothetical protein
VPRPLGPFGDGASTMDDGSIRKPRVDVYSGEGGVIRAVDYCSKTGRYAAFSSSQLSD